MGKYSKAIGGGAGGGIGALIASAIIAQFPAVSPEMAILIGAVFSTLGGALVAYRAPANK